ncbi:MAG: hypothetical protein FWC89_01605 [Defluviitaleaceae bacterium]|nr:hypothetical protein [Defluviitaleaceae bacterium]
MFRRKKPQREKRARQVPSLTEREKTRPPRPKPLKKPTGQVIQIDPRAPIKLESKDTVFIVYRTALKNFPWKKLAATFLIILFGGIGSAATQARVANTQNDVSRAEATLRYYQAANVVAAARLQEHYTWDEIERIARYRLGMSLPDQSQIINISVPRQGGVVLNTDDTALPQYNYFWHDSIRLLSGLINQIFGG